jgi:MOSC domain-containing protein YiiM
VTDDAGGRERSPVTVEGMSGSVVGVFTSSTTGGAIVSHDEIKAVAGRGLEGDRYFESNQDDDHDPAREITLITAEGIELSAAERGVVLGPGEHRRNVVIRGVDLLEFVGGTIRVGDVEVEVLQDNPPCRYLQELTGKRVVTGLRGNGGVRGRIVAGGVIRVGDSVAAVG